MQFLILFNIVVLTGLALLLLREELRFRRFGRTVEQTRADLVAIVHQLRSPLGNLRKFTDFLQRKEFGTLTLSQQEAVSNIETSLGESLLLLDRLLARSRLEEPRMTPDTEAADVRSLVHGAMDAVRPVMLAHGHTMTLKGGNGVRAKTDPLLLHGILDELLSNAAYYSPAKGRITVTVGRRGGRAAIEIRDTGIGVSDAERPHIFEKFFRGDRARKMHGGNGLGLAFAKEFAEKMGGTLQCQSKEGKGSVFTLVLGKK